jgi:hypothetical protein
MDKKAKAEAKRARRNMRKRMGGARITEEHPNPEAANRT